jgi:AcrR family transcriptional regulator
MKNGADQHERSVRGKKSRADILAAALDVFSELGPDGATLRLVARRAGVNIATLMYYFPSKESLFAEVVGLMEGGELHIVEVWRDSLTDSRLSQIDSLKEALTELGTMIIDRVIRDPSRFRLGVYSALDTSRPEQVVPAGSSKNPSPEKEVVRSVLTRAVGLGTLHCDPQEIEDYIEGYTYLSRGFAIAHIKEIAKGSKKRNVIIQRFRKLIYRYINNMLPGEKE